LRHHPAKVNSNVSNAPQSCKRDFWGIFGQWRRERRPQNTEAKTPKS